MLIGTHCFVFLLLFLQNYFIYGDKSVAKLDKLNKPSDFKLKLAKEHSAEHKSLEKELSKLDYEKYDNASKEELGITVPPEFGDNYTLLVSHHIYYNSTFYMDPAKGEQFWVDMNPSRKQVNIHDMLSNSHRQATTVVLTFGFPFYGSILNNVTIATGGFLYMGDYLHNWIAATQYIAPLMANFDTSQSLHSQIKYSDNGTAFTVEWDNVFIQDKMKEGEFTFQVTLLKNGDIIFAYKNVPYAISNITDDRHPVKIGISDAYILERSLFFVKRKTIYEYHRIDFLKQNISNGTAIYFTALPTCVAYKTCNSCLEADSNLECSWCNAVNRCSDGIDRSRQNWVVSNCPSNPASICNPPEVYSSTEHGHVVPRKGAETHNTDTESTTLESAKTTFKYGPSSDNTVNIAHNSIDATHGAAQYIQETSSTSGMSVGAIITLAVFAVVLVSVGIWAAYAYKFPQSSSGQFLIKYRPSQWALKKEGSSIITSSRHF